MKILVTGGKGMLGRTLQRRLAPQHELFVADLPETDILRPDSLGQAFRVCQPEAVIHCAAMTKVDDCESNEELAFRLNGMGSANVAKACRDYGARLVAISTDYVFDGRRAEGDYAETDFPRPQTVYGKSKLAGERSVLDILPNATILRIAWLYGAGGPSFVHTMAKLGAQEGAPLKVVDDQRGNPTSTDAVAGAVAFLLGHPEITGPAPRRSSRAPRRVRRTRRSRRPSSPRAATRCRAGRTPSPRSSPPNSGDKDVKSSRLRERLARRWHLTP